MTLTSAIAAVCGSAGSCASCPTSATASARRCGDGSSPPNSSKMPPMRSPSAAYESSASVFGRSSLQHLKAPLAGQGAPLPTTRSSCRCRARPRPPAPAGPFGTRSRKRATAAASPTRPIISATTRAPTSSRCLDKTAPVIGAPSRGREEHRSHHATYSRRSGRPPTPQVQSHAETCVAFCPTRSEPAARVRCVELAPERGTRRRRDGSTRSDDARARAALAISVLQRPFLPPQGRSSSRLTRARFGETPTRYALAAAQATDVLLDAIAASDGTRASATRSLFKTKVSNGILGSFLITPTGDTTLNAVAVHRIVDGKVTTMTTVDVPDALATRSKGPRGLPASPPGNTSRLETVAETQVPDSFASRSRDRNRAVCSDARSDRPDHERQDARKKP